MSHIYKKVETEFQEGWSPTEKHKFLLWRNNSCDYVSLYQNGECLFSLPDDVFHKLLDLLNGDVEEPVTIDDLKEARIR